MLRKLTAKTHMAMGQTFLVTTFLLAGVFLGIVPDRTGAIRDARSALAEAVAVNGSALLTRTDMGRLETTLAGAWWSRSAITPPGAVRAARCRRTPR